MHSMPSESEAVNTRYIGKKAYAKLEKFSEFRTIAENWKEIESIVTEFF